MFLSISFIVSVGTIHNIIPTDIINTSSPSDYILNITHLLILETIKKSYVMKIKFPVLI